MMNGGVFAPDPPPTLSVPLMAIPGGSTAPRTMGVPSVMFVGSAPVTINELCDQSSNDTNTYLNSSSHQLHCLIEVPWHRNQRAR